MEIEVIYTDTAGLACMQLVVVHLMRRARQGTYLLLLSCVALAGCATAPPDHTLTMAEVVT